MATQASSGAPRVLVVDDEAMLADLLSQALRHEGWETATSCSSPRATLSLIVCRDCVRERTIT